MLRNFAIWLFFAGVKATTPVNPFLEAVRRRMDATGWRPIDLSRELKGKVSQSTVYGFLRGANALNTDALAEIFNVLGLAVVPWRPTGGDRTMTCNWGDPDEFWGSEYYLPDNEEWVASFRAKWKGLKKNPRWDSPDRYVDPLHPT